MKVGIPKEIKVNESRISMTPMGVMEMCKHGHTVFVQSEAGLESGFSNEDYISVGAEILPTIEDVYSQSEMIIKVKEPVEQEYSLLKPHHTLYTYLHLASNKKLTQAMIDSKATCIAYETVENSDRTLPLLTPMSEVAGRMSVQEGAKYLEKPMGGAGVLLGGVPGVEPAKVLILGGGVVGTEAAKMAAGMGADVSILDVNHQRLRYLSEILPANVRTVFSNEYTIRELVKTHHLIIGAVLLPGAKAPHLVTRDMFPTMQKGTVLVDVAVDQGGCFETTKPTTHLDPVFTIDNVIHYCVANMPGAVPRTSTIALTNVTLRHAIDIANNGWKKACQDSLALKKGLNVINGEIVYKAVSEAFNFSYTDVEKFL